MKTLKILHLCFLFSLLVVIISCGTSYKSVQLDPATGYFPTDIVVSPNEILVEKKIDIDKYENLIVIVKTDSDINFIKVWDFVIDSMKNMKIFKNVFDARKNPGQDNSLLCLLSLMRSGCCHFQCDVSIRTPEETVLKISRAILNDKGLDQLLFYPIFNSIKEWALND